MADVTTTAFLLPLFDVGVVIPLRDAGGVPAIGDVCGRIGVLPFAMCLRRGATQVLCAKSLRRIHTSTLQRRSSGLDVAGYIPGLIDEAPAVITLNMRAAAACMNEFIARAYPYRLEPNERHARTFFSLAACGEEFTAESAFVGTATLLSSGVARSSPSSGCHSWRRYRLMRLHEIAFLVAALDVTGTPCASTADCRGRQIAQETAAARCRSRAR